MDLSPGRWAVVCAGPAESAEVALIVPNNGRGATTWLSTSPFRTLPSLVRATYVSEAEARDVAKVLNLANHVHIRRMGEARRAANQEWQHVLDAITA